MITLDVTPVPAVDAGIGGLSHYVCRCYDHNLAFCGRDVTHDPWDVDEPLCVVCDDLHPLDDDPCPTAHGPCTW